MALHSTEGATRFCMRACVHRMTRGLPVFGFVRSCMVLMGVAGFSCVPKPLEPQRGVATFYGGSSWSTLAFGGSHFLCGSDGSVEG